MDSAACSHREPVGLRLVGVLVARGRRGLILNSELFEGLPAVGKHALLGHLLAAHCELPMGGPRTVPGVDPGGAGHIGKRVTRYVAVEAEDLAAPYVRDHLPTLGDPNGSRASAAHAPQGRAAA